MSLTPSPLPLAGSISIKDINDVLFPTANLGGSLTTHEYRESQMNKDDPISIGDFRGTPCGMYKNRLRAMTPANGPWVPGWSWYDDINSDQVSHSVKPLSSYNDSNNLNYDPWRNVIEISYMTRFAGWSASNLNFFFYTPTIEQFSIEFGWGQGTNSDSTTPVDGIYLVINGYDSGYAEGNARTHVNRRLAFDPIGTINQYSNTFTTGSNLNIGGTNLFPYTVISMQLVLGNIYAIGQMATTSWQGLKVKQL